MLLTLTISSELFAQTRKTYTLAVVPQVPPVEIYRRWSPFVELLSKELGCDVKLVTYASIQQFEVGLLAGKPDFAYMNPYHMVMAKKKQGYLPLVKNKSGVYGIIVVDTRSSSIDSIQDLNEKEIAFPAPNAFYASLYMRTLLTEKEKVRMTPRYMKTHANVYRNVVQGTVLAGGGASNTLAAEPQTLREHLKIIYRTPTLTSYPIGSHPRIPQSVRDKFTKLFVLLSKCSINKEIFANILMPDPVKSDYSRDFFPLEKLGVEKYWVDGE